MAVGGAAALVACGPGAQTAATPQGPQAIEAGTACSLDGMTLVDYPGPKGQIQYSDGTPTFWTCDTLELIGQLQKPEQVRPIRGAWVQDMAATDWERPQGTWIDARSAFYVFGGRFKGSMGPTAASFKDEAAAQAFAQKNGGKVLPFAQVTPDLVDLTGGALHDSKM